MKRVNAKVLHAAVVAEIAWIAAHETRLEVLIREATARLPKPTELKAEAAKLAKSEREKERALRGVVSVIEGGRGQGLVTLAARVAELETELTDLRNRRGELEARAGILDAERPSLAVVSAAWQSFGKVWEVLTEGERGELIPLLVDEVRMTNKNEGTLQLVLQGSNDKDGFTSLSQVCKTVLHGCGSRTYLEQFWHESRSVRPHRRGNCDAEANSNSGSRPLYDISRRRDSGTATPHNQNINGFGRGLSSRAPYFRAITQRRRFSLLRVNCRCGTPELPPPEHC